MVQFIAQKEEHQQTLFIRIINKNNKAVENKSYIMIIQSFPGIQVLDYSTDAVYNNSITVQVYNENPKKHFVVQGQRCEMAKI